MPQINVPNFMLLPEIRLMKTERPHPSHWIFYCFKVQQQEYCPYCAQGNYRTHDHRLIQVRDEPFCGKKITLRIKKRRLLCKSCGKIFSEPIPGILPRKRFTQRFKRSLLWACETFSDLKKVKKTYQCSYAFLYQSLYETLELNVRRHINYPWPKIIGIDEHSFGKCPVTRRTRFATMIVDYKNKRPMELVEGKSGINLSLGLAHIKGREHVTHIALDLADPYKKFAREFFPKAELVADKFHVLRLLGHDLLRHRKQITGNRADWKARALLTMSSKKRDYWQRKTIYDYLKQFPSLNELYHWKEALHGFYRIKGYFRARQALTAMLDRMAQSPLKEIQRLRKTLHKWKEEILNYFKTRITNARTEGFNNVAKLVKRRAFGYKSFRNYRLRVLNACV